MNTILMNSKNSKSYDPHTLLLNLTDKINLKRNYKYVALSNFNMCCTWKNIKKSHIRTINLKYQLQHGVNHQMDHILYQAFKVIFKQDKI